MIAKLNKSILILYKLCGVGLLMLAGAGMAPPVGWAPPSIWTAAAVPFIALISCHIALWYLKRNADQ